MLEQNIRKKEAERLKMQEMLYRKADIDNLIDNGDLQQLDQDIDDRADPDAVSAEVADSQAMPLDSEHDAN